MSIHLNPEPFERELRRVAGEMQRGFGVGYFDDTAEVSATPNRYYLHSDGAVEYLDDIEHRARLKLEAQAEGLSVSYYDEDTKAFQAAYRNALTQLTEVSATPMRYMVARDMLDEDNETPALTAFGAPVERKRGNVMWVEPDEDDEVQVFRGFEPRPPAKPMCSSSHCYCGGGKRLDCAWFRARHSANQHTTDVEVIAQQLWAESRELLAKVDVELPSSPPPPVRPVRWYRHPLVKRFGWFGAVPALVSLVLFYALSGELLFGGPTVAFLWGAFVTYEMTARTDARGIRVTSRLKLRHLVARVLAIAAFSLLIGWLT